MTHDTMHPHAAESAASLVPVERRVGRLLPQRDPSKRTEDTMTTTFNPEGKPILTYGEALGPAMKITEPEDAEQYLAAYVEYLDPHVKRDRTDGMTAADVARVNLGYWAGYYDSETRARVERLFSCAHPIFGKLHRAGGVDQPTPSQAFAAGKAM